MKARIAPVDWDVGDIALWIQKTLLDLILVYSCSDILKAVEDL